MLFTLSPSLATPTISAPCSLPPLRSSLSSSPSVRPTFRPFRPPSAPLPPFPPPFRSTSKILYLPCHNPPPKGRGRYRLCNQHLRLTKPDQLIEGGSAPESASSIAEDAQISGSSNVCQGHIAFAPTSPQPALLLTVLNLRLKPSSVAESSYFRLARDDSPADDSLTATLLNLTASSRQQPIRPVYIRNASRLSVAFRYAEPLVEFHPYLMRVQS